MTTHIHELNPVIYPFKIWVTTNPDHKLIIDNFYGLDSDYNLFEIEEKQLIKNRFIIATTFAVVSKLVSQSGLLIVIKLPTKMDAETIAHESAHCADYICENLGIVSRTFDDGEAYAYLLGWIVGEITKLKKRNFKPITLNIK